MRAAHLILTLLLCLGTVAGAEVRSGSGTGSSSKKQAPSKPSATSKGTGSKVEPSKKAPTSAADKGTAAVSTSDGGKKDSAESTPKKASSDDESPEDEGTDERDPAKAGKKAAAVSSLTPEEIEGFDAYPAATQQLIRRSLELTTRNLRYQFGSADPKAGGMDCSGTMYRVLQDAGIKDVPRQSDEICRWVMRRALLYRTEDTSTLKDKSLSALKPGDLLFWTGTYDTSSPRELPISHVMLYLGKRKKDGKQVVFGASDGRTYDGQRRNGVSVFDFVMPRRNGKAAFYGYGPVPGLQSSATADAGK